MPKPAVGVLALLVVAVAAHGQTTARSPSAGSSELANMPSEAEIGELLSKASEYIETYKRTFAAAKGPLEKAIRQKNLWVSGGSGSFPSE
jgi:hypothetical protein